MLDSVTLSAQALGQDLSEAESELTCAEREAILSQLAEWIVMAEL